MEDLDSLLEDLGRGKSTSTAKKQRPPSSRVDLNELEDLMEDLAAPTAKQTPAVTSVSVPQAVSVPEPVAATESTVDDLDALMESLNASSRNSRRQSTRPPTNIPSTKPVQKPVQEPPKPAQEPPKPVQEPPKPSPEPPKPVQEPPKPAPEPPKPAPELPQPVTTSAPPPSDDLDKLLDNLNSQMNNIDVTGPASRGTCGTCNQPILGEIIQAMGKTFHPEHWVCYKCRDPLGTRSFYEVNEQPFCENCFQSSFCPKCAHCQLPVMDRCIAALGQKWHVEHFVCAQCLKPFPGGNFFERDNKPYCEADFYALFAPKCGGCNEPIRGDCINALGQQWHPEHFSCNKCGKSFAGGTFFEYGGKPYCETHYHEQSGSLCAGCGKPITGRCVNALEKKWHPEHFVCAFCMKSLAGGSFTEYNSKAYCRECHDKLFTNK